VGTDTNKKQFILNFLSSYSGSAISALVGIVSAPISLNYWHVERYGVWAVITSMAAYLSASGIGIDVACGILMTKNASISKKELIFSRCLKLLVYCAALFGLIFVVFTIINPSWLHVLGKMSEETYQEASKAAVVFIISFFLGLPFGAVSNAIVAYQKAYYGNFLNALAPVASLGVLLITVSLKLDMFAYAIISCSLLLVINICRCFLLSIAKKKYSYNAGNVNDSDKDTSYDMIIRTGLHLSFYSIALMISSNIGNLIISNKIDSAHVTPYSIATKLFSICFMFVATTIASAMPLVGKELSLGNWPWIKKTHKSLYMVTIFMCGAIWLGGVLFLKPIIGIWVGLQGYPGLLTVIMLGAFYFFYGLEYTNNIITNALNYTRKLGLISWAEMIIYLGTTFSLINIIGISAIPLGLLISNLAVAFWAFPSLIKRRSNGALAYDKKIFVSMLIVVLSSVGLGIAVELLISESFIKMLVKLVVLFLYVAVMLFLYRDEILDSFVGVRIKNIFKRKAA
jgi:O-antigen/teichoic acid export membrane protein